MRRHHSFCLAVSVALAALLPAPPAAARSVADDVADILLRATLEALLQPGPHVANPYAPVPGPITPIELQVVIIPDPSVRMKDEAVAYQSSVPADPFRVRDFSRTFVTAVGGSAKDASALVQQDGLQDPAMVVGDDLAQAISRHYGGRYAGAAPAAVTVPGPAAAPGAPLGDGFLVEVTTLHW